MIKKPYFSRSELSESTNSCVVATIPPSPCMNSKKIAAVCSFTCEWRSVQLLNSIVPKFGRNGSYPSRYFSLSINDKAPIVRPLNPLLIPKMIFFPLCLPHFRTSFIVPSIASVPLLVKNILSNSDSFNNRSASCNCGSWIKKFERWVYFRIWSSIAFMTAG